MDPDAALAAAREAAALADEATNGARLESALEALEHYQALDEWISKGGFLPRAWASTVGALPAL